eukprot:365376-Chlamydomonas_euryale.AAC.2
MPTYIAGTLKVSNIICVRAKNESRDCSMDYSSLFMDTVRMTGAVSLVLISHVHPTCATCMHTLNMQPARTTRMRNAHALHACAAHMSRSHGDPACMPVHGTCMCRHYCHVAQSTVNLCVTCVILSRFVFGFSGASVSSTGCS